MNIKALEAKAIHFENQVLKVAKKLKNSKLLEQISKAQEEARKAYEKSRKLYQEYLDSN
jgi:hypothetical protein